MIVVRNTTDKAVIISPFSNALERGESRVISAGEYLTYRSIYDTLEVSGAEEFKNSPEVKVAIKDMTPPEEVKAPLEEAKTSLEEEKPVETKAHRGRPKS